MGFVLAALLTMAPAQERAELPEDLDTWYTVIRDKQAVGYLHEGLKQAIKPGRYEYVLECELDLKPHAEEYTWSAQLDDTLTPTELASEVHSNGFPYGLVMYTGEDRRLEARPFVGEPVLWTHPARDDFHLLPTLTLYALRQNDTLSKPGRITLRTADARSVEVVIEVGEPIRRAYLGKEGWVIPVRFLKPFPAPSRETELVEAFVDRYGRIVEGKLAGGARILIAENNLEALAAVGFSVRRQGRRDIFDKLTAMQNAARERDPGPHRRAGRSPHRDARLAEVRPRGGAEDGRRDPGLQGRGRARPGAEDLSPDARPAPGGAPRGRAGPAGADARDRRRPGRRGTRVGRRRAAAERRGPRVRQGDGPDGEPRGRGDGEDPPDARRPSWTGSRSKAVPSGRRSPAGRPRSARWW